MTYLECGGNTLTGQNENMTLRELCRTLDISRRTVQGYEAQGLVTSTGKTNMGHLLYDISAQKRIQRIRQYQKYGFKIKEITMLLDASDEQLKLELEKRLSCLRREAARMKQTIAELKAELASLE